MKQHEPLNFIRQKLIFLPKSSDPPLTGQPVGKFLAPYQERIIRAAFKHDGTPNKSIVMAYSRKWGKSILTSWCINYLLECKEGMNALTAASTFSQSSHIFQQVADQILHNPKAFKCRYKITKERIENLDNGNSLGRIYSNASANKGQVKVGFFVFDQIEGAKDRSNYDSIQTGMMLQAQKPHIFLLSNVPEEPSHWSLDFIKSKRKDSDFTFFEHAADMKRPWDTELALKQANPLYDLYARAPKANKHLKGFINNVRHQRDIAKKNPSEAITFRRDTLGQKFSQKDFKWVLSSDLRVKPLKEALNWKYRAIVGIDLAESRDFCAAAICLFNRENKQVCVHPMLYVAGIGWRTRTQQKQFRQWSREGHIVLQEDRQALNPQAFLQDIDSFLREHKIRPAQFVFDRGLASATLVDGYNNASLFAMTAYQMTAALRHIQARAAEHELFLTSDNPAAKWMFDCAKASGKSKGYTLLDRDTIRESIDLPQAVCLSAKWHLDNPLRGYTYMTG